MKKQVLTMGGFLMLLALACNFVQVIPLEPTPITEIPAETPAPPTQEGENQEPTPTPIPTETPTPEPTPTATATQYFLQYFSLCAPNVAVDAAGRCCPYGHTEVNGMCTYIPPATPIPAGEPLPPPTPRHGLLIAFILPALCIGIPWLIAELYVVRYVQPRGIDLSTIRIKGQDGLFIDATLSLTARRTLTLASTRMTWPRVRGFVEKPIEQELIHEALQYPNLEMLELGLKEISENFRDLPIVHELSEDFGVEVMRFNIEAQYSQETMDAINRKAEASAGGNAYLAYAAAAHLDPDSPEARELYRVYQETTGRVDAARNLGGGLTSLAEVFTPKQKRGERSDDSIS